MCRKNIKWLLLIITSVVGTAALVFAAFSIVDTFIGDAASKTLLHGAASADPASAQTAKQLSARMSPADSPETTHVALTPPPVPLSASASAEKLPGGADDPEWFILELNVRRIEAGELVSFDDEQLAYIRNGVYALSGQIFKTQKYRDYFESKDWYFPYSDDAYVIASRMNACQNANAELIIKYING